MMNTPEIRAQIEQLGGGGLGGHDEHAGVDDGGPEDAGDVLPLPARALPQPRDVQVDDEHSGDPDPEMMKQMGAAAGGSGGMMNMLESMMEDPKMQEMFYPYLPEPFRNPETFKWMMNTPEIRAQIEQQLDQAMSGNMSPDMANMMGQAGAGAGAPGGMGADYNAQFEQMGVSPEDVMKKIMERPDLAAKFQN